MGSKASPMRPMSTHEWSKSNTVMKQTKSSSSYLWFARKAFHQDCTCEATKLQSFDDVQSSAVERKFPRAVGVKHIVQKPKLISAYCREPCLTCWKTRPTDSRSQQRRFLLPTSDPWSTSLLELIGRWTASAILDLRERQQFAATPSYYAKSKRYLR